MPPSPAFIGGLWEFEGGDSCQAGKSGHWDWGGGIGHGYSRLRDGGFKV